MRLVNTFMSKKKLTDIEIELIRESLIKEYCKKLTTHIFDNRGDFFEVDFDLYNIVFKKRRIYKDINRLIKTHERILEKLHTDVDIIVANDDTETEVVRYENDMNDISKFGLFITKRDVPDIEPYYSSTLCNAYLNFECVSFDVFYPL